MSSIPPCTTHPVFLIIVRSNPPSFPSPPPVRSGEHEEPSPDSEPADASSFHVPYQFVRHADDGTHAIYAPLPTTTTNSTGSTAGLTRPRSRIDIAQEITHTPGEAVAPSTLENAFPLEGLRHEFPPEEPVFGTAIRF